MQYCRRDPEWNFEEVLKDIQLEDFQLQISRNRDNPRKNFQKPNKAGRNYRNIKKEGRKWCKFCEKNTHNSTACHSKAAKGRYFITQKAYFSGKIQQLNQRKTGQRRPHIKQHSE